ncbi:MAG: hypothetical protein IKN49_03160 [Elusimicrobiaceae bacterium]|nr:hypothetical protein [Elusimicrobiaceae bacterium]
MKQLLSWLDPYKQSFIYFRWDFWSVLICISAVVWGCLHAYQGMVSGWLNNMFVYLPNYLTHEFSHRMWCTLRWEWWCYASGNAMETLIPFFLCIGALRLRGGRYVLPLLLYWLATTLYGAGIYAADARAMSLPLTSSDMVSNFTPGTVKGDWHYILQPLGLLEWDVVIGHILVYCGVVCLVMAVYSLYYYWTHTEQYIGDVQWN